MIDYSRGYIRTKMESASFPKLGEDTLFRKVAKKSPWMWLKTGDFKTLYPLLYLLNLVGTSCKWLAHPVKKEFYNLLGRSHGPVMRS